MTIFAFIAFMIAPAQAQQIILRADPQACGEHVDSDGGHDCRLLEGEIEAGNAEFALIQFYLTTPKRDRGRGTTASLESRVLAAHERLYSNRGNASDDLAWLRRKSTDHDTLSQRLDWLRDLHAKIDSGKGHCPVTWEPVRGGRAIRPSGRPSCRRWSDSDDAGLLPSGASYPGDVETGTPVTGDTPFVRRGE